MIERFRVRKNERAVTISAVQSNLGGGEFPHPV